MILRNTCFPSSSSQQRPLTQAAGRDGWAGELPAALPWCTCVSHLCFRPCCAAATLCMCRERGEWDSTYRQRQQKLEELSTQVEVAKESNKKLQVGGAAGPRRGMGHVSACAARLWCGGVARLMLGTPSSSSSSSTLQYGGWLVAWRAAGQGQQGSQTGRPVSTPVLAPVDRPAS
jgi:hypothetical protein